MSVDCVYVCGLCICLCTLGAIYMCETTFGRNHDNDFCVNANFWSVNAKARLNQLCQNKVETAKFLQISYSRTTMLPVFQIHIYYNNKTPGASCSKLTM